MYTKAYKKINVLVILFTILTLHSAQDITLNNAYVHIHMFIQCEEMDSTLKVPRHLQVTCLHTNTHFGSDTFQNFPVGFTSAPPSVQFPHRG
jgi:hypothetical protein